MADLVYKLVVDMSTRGSLAPAMEKVGKSGGVGRNPTSSRHVRNWGSARP